MVGEAISAVLGLAQIVGLDRRAHGAIEDQDALGEELLQGGFDVVHLVLSSLGGAPPEGGHHAEMGFLALSRGHLGEVDGEAGCLEGRAELVR